MSSDTRRKPRPGDFVRIPGVPNEENNIFLVISVTKTHAILIQPINGYPVSQVAAASLIGLEIVPGPEEPLDPGDTEVR